MDKPSPALRYLRQTLPATPAVWKSPPPSIHDLRPSDFFFPI